MPRTRTPGQWREILDAFDHSELSQAEFCRLRGLPLATFRYHRARAAAPHTVLKAPRLVELFAEPGNGMVEINNNFVENVIRPTAIGKKNWLFIGHPKAGQRSAIIYTMVENCRMHGIDPLAYLTDVMPKLMDREAEADVTDLLPLQWKAARPAN